MSSSFLLFGRGKLRNQSVKGKAQNVPGEIVALPTSDSPIVGKKLERHDHVLCEEGSGENCDDAPRSPLSAGGKDGRELLPSNAFAEGHEGNREEEHVITGVEAVPECAESVSCDETAVCTHVNVSTEPIGSFHVPHSAQCLHVWGSLKLKDSDIAGVLPTLHFTILIKAFKAGIPDVVRTLGIFPGKVVPLANEEKSDPHVKVTIDPGLGQELLGDDDGSGVLGIGGVQKRKLGGTNNVKTQAYNAGKKAFQSGPDRSRNFPSGLLFGRI